MEWKTKPKLESGQTRERLKFAWWPVECEDGKTRCFCKVRVVEIVEYVHGSLLFPSRYEWMVLKAYRAEVEE